MNITLVLNCFLQPCDVSIFLKFKCKIYIYIYIRVSVGLRNTTLSLPGIYFYDGRPKLFPIFC